MLRARFIACAVLALLAAAGCGESNANRNANQFAQIRKPGGVGKDKKKKAPEAPKPSKALVDLSNKIPTYSDPSAAQRVLGRRPNRVDENGDDRTDWYTIDPASNESLRLKYREDRLIGKEIVHTPPSAPQPTQAMPEESEGRAMDEIETQR